jgi:hypothetical protein
MAARVFTVPVSDVEPGQGIIQRAILIDEPVFRTHVKIECG